MSHEIWWTFILPHFNDMRHLMTYNNKSMMTSLLHLRNGEGMPRRALHRIRGQYVDGTWEPLQRDALRERLRQKQDYIVKGADTNNGTYIGILRATDGGFDLNGRDTAWDEIERAYGNDFVVEERVAQHDVLARFHPGSLNTMRILTFCWRGEIRYLLSAAKFGRGDSVTDNAATGGLWVGIDGHGALMTRGFDKKSAAHKAHPDTAVRFAGVEVPAWRQAVDTVVSRHRLLPHFGLVSWDVAIDRSGAPVIIEANYRGASFIYQLACQKPMFGELTEQVIEDVVSLPPATPPDWRIKQSSVAARAVRDLQAMRRSTSWRLTTPLRAVARRLRRRAGSS